MRSQAIQMVSFRSGLSRCHFLLLPSSSRRSLEADSFQITAVLAIITVSILNLISRTMGTRFSVIITTVKIFSLVFVFLLGLLSLIRNGAGPSFGAQSIFTGTSVNPGGYALALYSGLWAFDGWDQCNVSPSTQDMICQSRSAHLSRLSPEKCAIPAGICQGRSTHRCYWYCASLSAPTSHTLPSSILRQSAPPTPSLLISVALR